MTRSFQVGLTKLVSYIEIVHELNAPDCRHPLRYVFPQCTAITEYRITLRVREHVVILENQINTQIRLVTPKFAHDSLS